MVQIVGGVHGAKAVTISDVDEFMDYLLGQGDGVDPQDLYKAVAWTFWCVNLRANNIAQVPYDIYPMELEEDDEDSDNAIEWPIDLTQTLWCVEAWLCLKGAAYVLKRRKGQMLDSLQVLNANSMRVEKFNNDGPTLFRQQVGTQHKDFPADQIVYFRRFDPRNDIREGVHTGEVGQVSGALVKHANEWASAFFENGAIPAVFLTTEGAVPPKEKNRIRDNWEKILRGVQRAFRTEVLEEGLKPTVVGMPIKDLAMPDLDKSQREQILAAHLIPPGLAEAKTNRAERDSLQYELWTQALVPELTVHLGPALDKQLFNPLGLRISFKPSEVEAIQREEIAKAESSAFIVNGVIVPAYEKNLISIDEARAVINTVLIMGDFPKLDKNFTPEERVPPQLMAPQQQEEGNGGGEGPGNPTPPGNQVGNNTRPKALPPKWGQLPTVSLPSLAGGETKQQSGGDPATLTAI